MTIRNQTTIKRFFKQMSGNIPDVSDLHFYVGVLQLPWNQTVGLQLFIGHKLHFGFASSWACLSLNWQLWIFIEDQRMLVAFLSSKQERKNPPTCVFCFPLITLLTKWSNRLINLVCTRGGPKLLQIETHVVNAAPSPLLLLLLRLNHHTRLL